jgi:hypothetical protein
MKVIILTLCFFIAFLNFADAGEMYNCTDSDGNTILTDIPQDGMKCVSMDSSINSSSKQQTETEYIEERKVIKKNDAIEKGNKKSKPTSVSVNLCPGEKTDIYTSPKGILYIPKGGLMIFGHYLKLAFLAEPKKTGEFIRYTMDIDCNNDQGKILAGDFVTNKKEITSLTLNEIADRVKKIIGKYPTDREIINRVCELSRKYPSRED